MACRPCPWPAARQATSLAADVTPPRLRPRPGCVLPGWRPWSRLAAAAAAAASPGPHACASARVAAPPSPRQGWASCRCMAGAAAEGPSTIVLRSVRRGTGAREVCGWCSCGRPVHSVVLGGVRRGTGVREGEGAGRWDGQFHLSLCLGYIIWVKDLRSYYGCGSWIDHSIVRNYGSESIYGTV